MHIWSTSAVGTHSEEIDIMDMVNTIKWAQLDSFAFVEKTTIFQDH